MKNPLSSIIKLELELTVDIEGNYQASFPDPDYDKSAAILCVVKDMLDKHVEGVQKEGSLTDDDIDDLDLIRTFVKRILTPILDNHMLLFYNKRTGQKPDTSVN